MVQNNDAALLTRGTGKAQFLYRQLANLLRQEIQSGSLKPGDLLPSMDELARRYKLNKATVRQAIVELTTEGLVYSVPAKGTFVSEESKLRHENGTRTLSIGWINSVKDQGNTGRYHTEMMDTVRAAVLELGGHLLVFSTSDTSPTNIVKSVGEAKLDGALLVGPASYEPLCSLIKSPLPTVLIDDRYRGKRIDSVMVDNEGGGYQAAQHLIEQGHRQIAFVTGPLDWQVNRERLDGARAALADAGIPESQILTIQSTFAPEGGAQAIDQIIHANPRPTAVFFFNDEMAAGALQALYETSDLKVPQDLSFVGFDDIAWSSLTHPPLTTVRVEKQRMGEEAVKRLWEIINDPDHLPTTTIVPTSLVIRKSTTSAVCSGEES